MSASRDRSNPSRTTAAASSATTAATSKVASKALHGNRRLEDFYGTIMRRGPNRNATAVAPVAADNAAPNPETVRDIIPGKREVVVARGSISLESNQEVLRLRQRVDELEKLCQDKEEQLKAVSNNRTILHTALKSALAQREKELDEARRSKERLAQNASRVIEKLVQSARARDARELREKLALDGARLGRIVYSRAGLRNTVESWEDGHATKQLQKRRKELQAQRKALEQRQEAAHRATLRLQEEHGDKENHSPTGSGDANVESVGGILVRSELDAMEAEESVRFHLNSIREKEKELDKEEQALNDEKGAHIRALKRVASEDASRFRSRPTVRTDGKVKISNTCIVHLTASCIASFIHLSSCMIATYYFAFWVREDFQKCGGPTISLTCAKLQSRFTNWIRGGPIPKRKIIPSTSRGSTKFIATYGIHVLCPFTMYLKLTPIPLPPFWNAAMELTLILCSRSRGTFRNAMLVRFCFRFCRECSI